MPRDPFALDAAGNKVDYVATIDVMEFATGEYDFQATARMKYEKPVEKDDGTLSTGRPEFVKVGPKDKWVALEGGTAFGAASGDKDARVRADSVFGRWVTRTLELVGKDALIAEGRSDPHQASFWEGLKFHFETEGDGDDYSFKDRETGERKKGKTKGYTIMTEYLGGQASINKSEGFDPASLGLPDSVLDQLAELANTNDFPTYQTKALENVLKGLEEGSDERRATSMALSNQKLYEALQTVS